MPIVFPVHPRTRARLNDFGLLPELEGATGMRLIAPLSYIAFMNLVTDCALVVTDSGGVQEETTYLGIPCRTVRDTTERPITVSEGSNQLIKPSQIYASVVSLAGGARRRTRRKPDLWDGRAAQRAVESLRRRCFGREKELRHG
jgi:UDP-N-acetylglucosamine 2-epimerase (non-hydrolysing)